VSDHKPRLLFKNPVFESGVNVTVRYGTKWSVQAPPESIVEVWETNGGYLFDAFIVDTELHRVCDIPEDLLHQEHDPACRTHEGLLAVLRKVYGSKINSRVWVTVVAFEQCEPDPGEHDDPIEAPATH